MRIRRHYYVDKFYVLSEKDENAFINQRSNPQQSRSVERNQSHPIRPELSSRAVIEYANPNSSLIIN
jgi:hypothetical protein